MKPVAVREDRYDNPFGNLNYTQDPSAYARDLNQGQFTSTATSPVPVTSQPATTAPTPLQETYSWMGQDIPASQALQFYAQASQPGYLDAIDQQYRSEFERLISAIEPSLGVSNTPFSVLNSTGDGRGGGAYGSGYNAAASPGFGFTDALRGAMAVSSPIGLGLAMAGVNNPLGALADMLGFGDAMGGGGIAGSSDGTGHGAGEVGSDGLP